MFTNKHVVIAAIVAPLLALLAWFGVGHWIGEQPAPAQTGQAYPLVEQSNCRWESGACDLRNAEFNLRLTLQQGPAGPEIELVASHPLQGVVLALGAPDTEVPPSAMRASDGQGYRWRIALAATPGPADRLRVAASAAGSSYFAEASTTFTQPRGE